MATSPELGRTSPESVQRERKETLEARSGGRGVPGAGKQQQQRRKPSSTRTGLTGGVVVSGSPGTHEAAKVASSLGLQGPAAPIGAQLLQASAAQAAAADDHHHATSATVYHANLLAGTSGNVQAAALAALQQQSPQIVAGSAGAGGLLANLGPAAALASMQASAEASSLDLQAMQSMEWLFKKERIYLLAQFWQQVSPRLYH